MRHAGGEERGGAAGEREWPVTRFEAVEHLHDDAPPAHHPRAAAGLLPASGPRSGCLRHGRAGGGGRQSKGGPAAVGGQKHLNAAGRKSAHGLGRWG